MRLVLIIYCVLAILALTGFATWLALDQKQVRSKLTAELKQVEELTTKADAAQGKLRALEEEQRLNRAAYTPQQAVQMSIVVQNADKNNEELAAAVRQAQHAADGWAEIIKRRQVWFVPIIGFALLHILGIFYFASPESKPRRPIRRA